MKKIYIIIFLLISSICTGEEKYGGTLRLASSSDPKTFNLIIAQETSTTEALAFLFEGLTKTNGITTEPEPCLAVSWTYSEDGLEWIFILREDVKWFDGKNFAADDVVFTFNRLIYNKDIPSSARDIFTIDGKPFKVEKLDTYKIKITTPTPFAPLLNQISQPILPKHILEESVNQGTFTQMWGINTAPDKIIGTGPFRLTEYIPGQRLVYEKNHDYWKKGLPHIDKIVTYIVPNIDAQLLKFRAGETDIVSVQGKDYALIKSEEKKRGYTIYDCGPSFGTNFIAFNFNAKPYFRDLKFRQAVAYALDKESMINNVLSGMGTVQYAAMEEPAKFFYNPNVRKYEHNPGKAKDLLKEVKDGPIKFTILTNAENNQRVDIGTIIQADLKAIGLDVSFRPIDFNNLVTKLNYTHDWDCVLIGFTGGVEPHSGKNVWAADGHLHIWNRKPQLTGVAEQSSALKLWEENLQPWEKEIDTLFNEGVKELDPEKRKKIYWKWQESAAENLPLIYTINSKAIFAVRNRLKNVQPTAYGGVLHNIEELYLEK